jgi:sec-independent protein translocase protein TatB
MLDFSFGKLAIIFALCLIVLGPEKLPKLAQQLGKFAGQARAMARHFRAQLEQEIAAEEFAKQKRELEAAVKNAVDTVTNPVDAAAKTANDAVNEIAEGIVQPSANNSGHMDHSAMVDTSPAPIANLASPDATKPPV